jgi:spermine synthase
MSVQTLLLDFSIDPARLGDESGQKAVFGQLETVLKDYIPNLILATDIKIDGGSLKLMTGKRGTTVSVRMFDRGLVTVNIEYYKEDHEEPLISFKVMSLFRNRCTVRYL